MKLKILITIIFIFATYRTALESTIEQSSVVYLRKNADFLTIYKEMRSQWEGNYVNHENDKGKETYGGVTRQYSPDWYGWRYIDEYKLNFGKPVRHQYFKEAEFWCMDFYLDIWVKEGFYKIHNQELAHLLFDLRINHFKKRAASLINAALEDYNFKIKSTKGEWLIEELNNIDPVYFCKNLRIKRENYYNRIVKLDPSQSDFLNGWLKRARNV